MVLTSAIFEIPQVRRGLVGARWHEMPVAREIILLVADFDLMFVLAADCLEPVRIAFPMIDPFHRPGPRQCIINYGRLVPENVGICLVQEYAFLHHSRVVSMKRYTA